MKEEEKDRIITMEQWCETIEEGMNGGPPFAFIDLPPAPPKDWLVKLKNIHECLILGAYTLGKDWMDELMKEIEGEE